MAGLAVVLDTNVLLSGLPFGEAAGWLSDDDVFTAIS